MLNQLFTHEESPFLPLKWREQNFLQSIDKVKHLITITTPKYTNLLLREGEKQEKRCKLLFTFIPGFSSLLDS